MKKSEPKEETKMLEKIKSWFRNEPEFEEVVEVIPESPEVLLEEVLTELRIANDLQLVDLPISDPRRAIVTVGRDQ